MPLMAPIAKRNGVRLNTGFRSFVPSPADHGSASRQIKIFKHEIEMVGFDSDCRDRGFQKRS
jgi:hypothetical protein